MRKLLRIVVLSISAIVLLFFIQKWGNNRDKRFYDEFNSANINGALIYSDIGYYMRVFKVKNNKMKFVFDPRLSIYQKQSFRKVAEKGDIIIKPAYADTLVLKKKEGTIYLFTFRKYE